MDLKINLVKNKKNHQWNISIPKKKLSKKLLTSMEKKKFIKLRILE
jgi:hypothetical protein